MCVLSLLNAEDTFRRRREKYKYDHNTFWVNMYGRRVSFIPKHYDPNKKTVFFKKKHPNWDS